MKTPPRRAAKNRLTLKRPRALFFGSYRPVDNQNPVRNEPNGVGGHPQRATAGTSESLLLESSNVRSDSIAV